jgi:hypothetical protein
MWIQNIWKYIVNLSCCVTKLKIYTWQYQFIKATRPPTWEVPDNINL